MELETTMPPDMRAQAITALLEGLAHAEIVGPRGDYKANYAATLARLLTLENTTPNHFKTLSAFVDRVAAVIQENIKWLLAGMDAATNTGRMDPPTSRPRSRDGTETNHHNNKRHANRDDISTDDSRMSGGPPKKQGNDQPRSKPRTKQIRKFWKQQSRKSRKGIWKSRKSRKREQPPTKSGKFRKQIK
jgi:hypothetical protein